MLGKQLVIAQHGAVYGRNFGDVLIQKIVADELRYRLDARVYFPRASQAFHQESNEDIGGIWRLLATDMAVFGPGGYLGERRHDQKSWNKRLLEYHGRFFRSLRLLRCPLVVYGVGVGPLSDPKSRTLVAEILDYASFIQLRDEASASYAHDLGVDRNRISVVPDVALSLDGQAFSGGRAAARTALGRTARPLIGLHLPVPATVTGSKVLQFRADVEAFVVANPDLSFILLFDSPSQKLPEDFQARLMAWPNVTWRAYEGPDRLLAAIAGCDHVLTTKLHVGICATALGVNPIGVFFHPKVQRFYDQIERPEFCTDIANYASGWLAATTEVALALDPAEIVIVSAQMRAQVRDSFAQLASAIGSATSKV